MKLLACCSWILLSTIARLSAQEVVAVKQVEMFKASGTVNGAATSASGSETTIGTAKPPAPTTVTTRGGTITTGADGAASLMLGEGAETGSARMGPDTEVKVPNGSKAGHSLEMLKGSLFMHIDAAQLKQRDGAEFKLKTPAALLAVKGTQFFSRTDNGTDTVGVHEGSVELTEPTTGQKLTLTAGQAAEVSPSVLSAMREMTAEEKGSASTYALAELEAVPLAVFLGSPGSTTPRWAWMDGKVQTTLPSWTAWRRLNSSIWFIQPVQNQSYAQMTAEGGILISKRVFVSIRLAPRRGEPVQDALGASVRPLIPAKELKALRFRMRQIGYNGLIFSSQLTWNNPDKGIIPLAEDDPAWKVYQLPIPALPKPAAVKDSKDLEYEVNLFLQKKEKKWDPALPHTFEIKDFTLLVLP